MSSAHPDCFALMLAEWITLRHFSVSAAMRLSKLADEPGSTMPRSASCALILGLPRAAFISLLGLSICTARTYNPLGERKMAHDRIALGVEKRRLLLNGKSFSLGGYTYERLIGCGANGCVVKAHNALLKRDEAVKLWLPKSGDRRDKVRQGMLEAQKQAAEWHPQVITIFHAGILDGIFYSTMQFVDAPNLKTWRKTDIATSMHKHMVAMNYLTLIEKTSKPDLFHGDPHAGNVLVTETLEPRLCDYGTSYYSQRDESWHRHWRIVDEVMCSLLSHLTGFAELRDRCLASPPIGAEGTINAYREILTGTGVEATSGPWSQV